MEYFAGLDVSVKDTSVCVVEETGKIVREVKVASEPEALLAVLRSPRYHSAGKRVLGGGFALPSAVATVVASEPVGDNAWRLAWQSNGDSGKSLRLIERYNGPTLLMARLGSGGMSDLSPRRGSKRTLIGSF